MSLREGDKIASQTLVAPFASAKGGKIRSKSSFPSLMAETSTHSNLKRPHSDDEETRQPSLEKRPRFPKGKKAKKGVEIVRNEESPSNLANSLLAAKERAHRRNRITAELFSEQSSGIFQDVTAAEVNYEAGGNFEDDGILIEPFNLKQEREEGYFDADGNFVECVSEKETKDAWLDSIDVGTQFAQRNVEPTNKEEEMQELSSEDIGKMKRRIADLLQPGETVLQALRRLRRSASGKKEKMPEHTKRIFDQLTEDSMKLMENGDYNVYHDEQEVFEREAEGYERVARAREVTTRGIGSTVGEDIFSSGVKRGESPPLSQLPSGVSNLNASVAPVSSDNDVDAFDMFGEDDENRRLDQPNNGDRLSVQNIGSESAGAGGELETGYVYDESSGYYYSSSLGYYYDPTSGLYCSAATGKWYSYNEQTGAYDEIVEEAASLAEDNAH